MEGSSSKLMSRVLLNSKHAQAGGVECRIDELAAPWMSAMLQDLVLNPIAEEITIVAGQPSADLLAKNPDPEVLIDICMSESSGYDFLRIVKASASLASITFVFLTSTMLEEEQELGLAFGARFLIRPMDPEELKEIEGCLQEAKPHVENSDR
jgi:CheY-like chemotaxis protein